TTLCASDPIAAALAAAETAVQAGTAKTKAIVLVTDGDESCGGDAVAQAAKLSAAGVRVWVIGFGQKAAADAGGIDNTALNELACAGRTADKFDVACVLGDAGAYVPLKATGPHIYATATTADEIVTAIAAVTGTICCG